MTSYADFLASKAVVNVPTGIEKPPKLNPVLFDFQRDITTWALKRGRAGIFANTGLGKTLQQLEAARCITEETKRPVLIYAPLAVAAQTIDEAYRMLEMPVFFSRNQSEVGPRGVYITNYAKREHFDPSAFGGVILDESAVLKGEDSATREAFTTEWTQIPFRLCYTATPAPNDFMEIGNHAEFLGVMTKSEMLSTFFVHDGGETQKWRLKGHAEQDFWKWMASWCVAVMNPRDLGYNGDAYDLPPMNIQTHFVGSPPAEGQLFAGTAGTLQERRGARRDSIEDRIKLASELANSNGEQWAVWCNLNDEGKALEKAINGAVEVAGADDDDHKEKTLLGFARGEIRTLVSKSSICGHGMNFQSCHNVIYFPDDSFERYYQALRRFWRYGQKSIVNVHLVLSESESAVLENLKRKEKEAGEMYANLVAHMADNTRSQLKGAGARTKLEYNPKKKLQLPEWLTSQ